MQWSSDRTGFPLLELANIGFAVNLFPIAKMQFERFLSEPVIEPAESPQVALFGDVWYSALLTFLPRVSLRQENPAEATPAEYEGLFLGGILPEEAVRFAKWLGIGYDLPQTADWRRIDQELFKAPLSADDAAALRSDDRLSRSARRLIDWWLDARRPKTWGQLALLEGGLLEWVRTARRGAFGGLGRPRPDFQWILLNPQRDQPVTPIRSERMGYFGFRLVKPL
jgi:hypothetical protein